MAMVKDSRIAQIERNWVVERERERVGEDCPGQRKTEEGNLGRCSGLEY